MANGFDTFLQLLPFQQSFCKFLLYQNNYISDFNLHVLFLREVKTCLQNEKVAVIGDSRMRNIYYEMVKSVSQELVSGKAVCVNNLLGWILSTLIQSKNS